MSRPRSPDGRAVCGVLVVVFALAVAFPPETGDCAQQALAERAASQQAPEVQQPPALKVKVSRWGRSLKLQLLDGAGKKFSARNRAQPPQFAIYQDDREIDSGQFEYG